jgi:5-methyltetrahydropteroyltriglutamate--homocysteine methyltransferase
MIKKSCFLKICFFFVIYRQAVIALSALSMVYPKAIIEGYSREEFLEDLINESEKEIRKCFES